MRPAISWFLILLGPLLSAALPLFIPIARNLEYEYATLSAYLALLLVPASAMILPNAPRLIAALFPLGLVLNILPGWLQFKFGLCACVESEFLFWWIVQTLPHLCLAFAAAALMQHWAPKHRGLIFVAYAAMLFLLFVHLAWMLWSFPQKRITHLLAGFIHGAIYDNGIYLDPGIIWARACHALLGFVGIAFVSLPRLRWKLDSLVCLSLLGGAFYASYKASPYPSVSHGLEALDKLMPNQKKAEYFTLHYRESKDARIEDQIQKIYDSARFHTEDLTLKLQIVTTSPHVHIYVYPSRREKKLWFGGDGTDITDVKTPSVHINPENWPHDTLRHELVHALASSFAFHGLGFHPNMAFTEGLAVALAPNEEDISLHAGAANIIRSQLIKNPTQLFSPLFWGESGRRAYTVAGSIIKFLRDRYGVQSLKTLYSGGTWSEVFGLDAEPLLKEWMEFLEKTYPKQNSEIAEESLFRYPGLLQDVCPHAKSMLYDDASQYSIAWRQPDGWVPAKDYWPWRMHLEKDPATRFQLLRNEAMLLLKDKAPLETMIQRVRDNRRDPPRNLEDVDLFLLEVDLLLAAKKRDRALSLMQNYMSKLALYQVGDPHTRQVWSRYFILSEKSTLPQATAWLEILSGARSYIPYRRTKNKSWILDYLFLRNHAFRRDDQKTLKQLQAISVPEGIPSTFEVEWYRSLGLQWFQIGGYREAERALRAAAKFAPEGKKESLGLYADEARWLLEQSKVEILPGPVDHLPPAH